MHLQGIGEEPPNFREGGQSVQPSDGEPEPPPQEEGVAGKGRDQIEGEMARWVSEPLEIPHRNKILLRSSEDARRTRTQTDAAVSHLVCSFYR